MQIVEQLENQLTKEQNRLEAMLAHLQHTAANSTSTADNNVSDKGMINFEPKITGFSRLTHPQLHPILARVVRLNVAIFKSLGGALIFVL